MNITEKKNVEKNFLKYFFVHNIVHIIFKSSKDKYEDLSNQIEESRLTFKSVSKSKTKCEKVNIPKSSSQIKPLNFP